MCRIIRLFLYTFISIHAVISIEATLGYYVMNKAIHMLDITLVRSPSKWSLHLHKFLESTLCQVDL